MSDADVFRDRLADRLDWWRTRIVRAPCELWHWLVGYSGADRADAGFHHWTYVTGPTRTRVWVDGWRVRPGVLRRPRVTDPHWASSMPPFSPASNPTGDPE